MNNLTVTTELKVVNGVIDAIERTLEEFSDPKTKSELYKELSVYHARQASLEEARGSESVASAIEIDDDPDLPEASFVEQKVEEAREESDAVENFVSEGAPVAPYTVDLVPPGESNFDEEAIKDVPAVEDTPPVSEETFAHVLEDMERPALNNYPKFNE